MLNTLKYPQAATAAYFLLFLFFVVEATTEDGGRYTAADTAAISDSSDSRTNVLDSSSQAGAITLLPILFYEPETKLGGGLTAAYYRRIGDAMRPSNIGIEVTYTQMRQFMVEFIPEYYSAGNDFRLYGECYFGEYPDFFYGIGNNTRNEAKELYTARYAVVMLQGHYFVLPRFHIGGRIDFRFERLTQTEEDGILGFGTLRGEEAWRGIGVGPVLTHDTRDNIFAATGGRFVEVSAVQYMTALSSSFDFGLAHIDARGFFAPLSGHVIGLQTVGMFSWGEIPFQMLPGIGTILRGYPEGRFRDRNMLAWQAEYRFPLWRRLRGAVFAGVGDVFNGIEDLSIHRLKVAAGPGLRYVFNKEGVSIRMDYGFSRLHGGAFYFTAREAF
ncbi:MAG: BamA/TamA family outer membrane protein [Chitinivibrionales bacterium]|nr:BamA/TamA family outer membrane protein [Chitinivibrionales bacterium]MBD3358693.1 BamA/TamA family outer membrane protein [Chitinivibrionales bacterium]